MIDSNHPISPLRHRFIEDMQLRKLLPKTQSSYIRAIKKLQQFLIPAHGIPVTHHERYHSPAHRIVQSKPVNHRYQPPDEL